LNTKTVLIFFLSFILPLTLKFIDYLYFHVYIESFTIVLSVFIFYNIVKNRANVKNAFFTFIGVGFLAVGVIDVLHTLSYKGMGIFPVDEVNVATQFWVLGRMLQAVTFLAGIVFSGTVIKIMPVFLGYFTAVLVGSVLIFTGVFPDALLQDSGLTLFKIYSEYVVIGILLLALLNIYRLRDNFEFRDHITLSAAIGLTILSEYCFTMYNDVYGLINFAGHILKMIAYLLVTTVYYETLHQRIFGKAK